MTSPSQPPFAPEPAPHDDKTAIRPATATAATGGRASRRSRLPVVLAVAVLAVILGIVGGTFLTGGVLGPATGETPTPTPTPQAPAHPLREFLEAVARGDGPGALGHAASQPADTSFLSGDVLATALAANPITEINVPAVEVTAEDDTVTVEASYKIGAERVTESYDLQRYADRWLVSDVAAEVDVSSLRSEHITMLVAGREVDSDTLLLFPGAYEVTSDADYIDWGEDNTLLVSAPDSYPGTGALDLGINDAGVKAFVAAAKRSLTECLKVKRTKPAGCPFGYDSTSHKIDAKTITWALDEDPWDDVTPRLHHDDDRRATASVSLRLSFKAKGKRTYNNENATLDETVYRSATATADLTAETIKITWE